MEADPVELRQIVRSLIEGPHRELVYLEDSVGDGVNSDPDIRDDMEEKEKQRVHSREDHDDDKEIGRGSPVYRAKPDQKRDKGDKKDQRPGAGPPSCHFVVDRRFHTLVYSLVGAS